MTDKKEGLRFEQFDEIVPGELGFAVQNDAIPRVDSGLGLNQELRLEGKVEAILFASPQPIKASEVFELLIDEDVSHSQREVDQTLTSLVRLYAERNGGFKLVILPGKLYQFQTVPAAKGFLEKAFSSKPRPLSRAALETLSIIAYKQPATRAEIEFVRGVDAGSIIKTLMDRDLIKCVGRKEDSGRPMLFGTTDEFLKVFKLESLEDLPPLLAFQPEQEILEASIETDQDPVDIEKIVSDLEDEAELFSDPVEDLRTNELAAENNSG